MLALAPQTQQQQQTHNTPPSSSSSHHHHHALHHSLLHLTLSRHSRTKHAIAHSNHSSIWIWRMSSSQTGCCEGCWDCKWVEREDGGIESIRNVREELGRVLDEFSADIRYANTMSPDILPPRNAFEWVMNSFAIPLELYACIMGQPTIARFRGDTAFGLPAKIVSTFMGGVVGMVMWYTSTGSGHGNPYGLSAVFFVCFPFFYERLYWAVHPMISIIFFVTAPLYHIIPTTIHDPAEVPAQFSRDELAGARNSGVGVRFRPVQRQFSLNLELDLRSGSGPFTEPRTGLEVQVRIQIHLEKPLAATAQPEQLQSRAQSFRRTVQLEDTAIQFSAIRRKEIYHAVGNTPVLRQREKEGRREGMAKCSSTVLYCKSECVQTRSNAFRENYIMENQEPDMRFGSPETVELWTERQSGSSWVRVRT
ncbi:hypothetical protein BDQ17DRAFT_1494718 [Cyathus striatus]|nr:hypothetical protein BDQ17DRAFT_1494718 [Cyathus striatus]